MERFVSGNSLSKTLELIPVIVETCRLPRRCAPRCTPEYRNPDHCDELEVRVLVRDGMCRLHRGRSTNIPIQSSDIRMQSFPVIGTIHPSNLGGDHIRNDTAFCRNLNLLNNLFQHFFGCLFKPHKQRTRNNGMANIEFTDNTNICYRARIGIV